MKTNFIKWFVLLFVATTAFVSCESTSIEDRTPSQSAEPTQVMTVLGKKLANPHAPEVVRQAFESVQKSNPEIAQNVHMDFNPTHMYVKFLPKDVAQLDELQQLYGFELDNIPAFYEFETLGDYYHDPSVAAGLPTYQYATLPVNTKLPSTISHEIVEQLILIDYSEQINGTTKYNEDFMLLLRHAQYRLTGLTALAYGSNEYDDANVFHLKSRFLWRPSGEVREQGRNGDFPASGVRVRMHDYTFIPLIKTGMTTGSDGKFRCGRRITESARYRATFSDNKKYTSSMRRGSPLKVRRINGPYSVWYESF